MSIEPNRFAIEQLLKIDPERLIPFLRRPVSGTYRNVTPAGFGSILELRVDIDGRRPQSRLSGDLYAHLVFCGIPLTVYSGSFVVENVTQSGDSTALTLTGPVVYYGNPSNTADSIEVHIQRVNYFAPPAAACVNWFTNGTLVRSYSCPKTSEYFRVATLEVDRFQGTVFPSALDPDINPSPSGLPGSVSVRDVYLRSGIDLTVVNDDVLNDPDSADVGDNWSEVELHDLMEDRFDLFANRPQWNLYAVIVHKFGDPNYNSGYYGTMFDWGGWQTGDTFLRQGCAIAEDAIRGRENGTLYDTSAKKDRLILQTLIHEIGHAFNLPHSWSRTTNPDAGSESFMNYPWGYTDNGGGETNFWANFRWEFDDVELIWMRHADRNDVIFGGRNWIGNNLSADLHPTYEHAVTPAKLEIHSPGLFDIGVPVHLTVQLTNTSAVPIRVVDRLQPEEGLLRVFIERPNGDIVSYVPPVYRLMAPPSFTELAPGESTFATVSLSFGAKGHQFAEPGQYLLRIYFPCFPLGFLATSTHRLRIAHPHTRASEELVHLLTSPEAAKFLYYGGTRRYPAVSEQLAEATERYAKTDPIAVRHISASLGRHASRALKRVEIKKGKRVISVSKPDHALVTRRLHEAMKAPPAEYKHASAFDALTETQLLGQLANSYLSLGHEDKAVAALEDGVKRIGIRVDGGKSAREVLQARIDVIRRGGWKGK